MAAPIVELRHVHLEVEGRVYLDGAQLRVEAGERVVIAGLPGCGKSFVPRLILGLPGMDPGQARVAGEVIVDGLSVPSLSGGPLQGLRRRIGSVMRDGGLIENMDIRRNIALPLNYHYGDVLGPAQIDRRCAAVLEDLGLARLGRPGIRPVALNREERLYASLARALSAEPFLLLLDDPAAGLSPTPAYRLCQRAFCYEPAFTGRLPLTGGPRPLTRIATTSDLGRYLDFGDRFVLLWEGRLEPIGDRDAVRGSTDARVRQLLEGVPEGMAGDPVGASVGEDHG